MTGISKEALKMILDWISCIYYLVEFQKDKGATIWALIDSDSKVNVMILAYGSILGFMIEPPDIKTQKIDSLLLRTFG